MPNTKIIKSGFMVVADDTHLSKWVEQQNDIEIARGFIAQYADKIPNGGTVIDVGACIGDHTATYSNIVGPTGRVIALECGGDSFACLAYNMDRHPNVVAIKAAAGKYPGRGYFVRNPNIGASHLEANHNGHVQIVTIDGLVKEMLLTPTFIKIDAEGWELAILHGAEYTLDSFSPFLVIEINEGALAKQSVTPNDVFDYLKSKGYSFRVLGRDKIGDPQFDILAEKK
jgi:FkbM family methyltransferase